MNHRPNQVPHAKEKYFRHIETGAPIPGPPPASWLGMALHGLSFYKDAVGFLRTQHARYGNLSALRTPRRQYLFAFGPEYNRLLHTSPDLFFPKPFFFPGPKGSSQERLRLNNLFGMWREKHKQHRHVLMPSMQKGSLAGYHANLTGLLDNLERQWQPGVRDVYVEMQNWTMAIAVKLLYGLDDIDRVPILARQLTAYIRLNRSFWARGFRFDLPFFPYRRLLRLAESLEGQVRQLIQEKQDMLGTDMLSLLLQAQSEMSEDEFIGHAIFMFAAAYETTATTLTWMLFLIAQHPDVYGDLLDELGSLNGMPPAMEQLDKLPLLDRVLKETLRILPTVAYTPRVPTADFEIDGYLLPARMTIVLSHYVTHHMPEIFPDPESFRPDRWLHAQPTPEEYMPFGIGPRRCLGATYAQFVIKMVMATILPRWRFTVVPNARINRGIVFSMYPRDGMPMTMAKQDGRLQRQPVSGNIHDMVHFSPPRTSTSKSPVREAA